MASLRAVCCLLLSMCFVVVFVDCSSVVDRCSVACCVMFGDCWLLWIVKLCVVGCWVFADCWLMFGVSCVLCVVCCVLHDVCCVVVVVCCL